MHLIAHIKQFDKFKSTGKFRASTKSYVASFRGSFFVSHSLSKRRQEQEQPPREQGKSFAQNNQFDGQGWSRGKCP